MMTRSDFQRGGHDEIDCNGAYLPFTRGRKAEKRWIQTYPIYAPNVGYYVITEEVVT